MITGEDLEWQSQLAEVVQAAWLGTATAVRDDQIATAISGDTAGVTGQLCVCTQTCSHHCES